MTTLIEIQRFADAIAERYKPEKIILFGSYAYGTPTPSSDVDLLVVMPFEGRSVRKAIEMLDSIEPRFGVDLLVRTPAGLQERLAQQDFFLRDVVTKGRILYEA